MYVDGESLDKQFFKKGDEIFQEGDPGDAAFLVETGSVGIFKTVEGEEIQLATMNDGELFGEMAIIDGSARMAHAVALDDSVVVAIPRAGLESLLAKQSPLVKTLIQILVDNLRNVHEIYMKRPRSVPDFFNAIHFHTQGLGRNLEANADTDPSGDGLKRLRLIEDQLEVLHEQFSSFKDRRASVLDESGEDK
ncbi:MAG: cyclic nucleotide-binding domain-containing protein [Alphaproteobacteria bacterium]|jgi:CRP/FNR family transcriptional regulator, cyclic AMP receptor protein|nr:cyclic nucleotide-binding domain-containing protein [Alphaproteobacteria bacterium]MBT7941850.1 cyclic nucleotide-binding domain-containing protein [Alphaproteobacteria bacterium]